MLPCLTSMKTHCLRAINIVVTSYNVLKVGLLYLQVVSLHNLTTYFLITFLYDQRVS